jgi:hypothetical protein
MLTQVASCSAVNVSIYSLTHIDIVEDTVKLGALLQSLGTYGLPHCAAARAHMKPSSDPGCVDLHPRRALFTLDLIVTTVQQFAGLAVGKRRPGSAGSRPGHNTSGGSLSTTHRPASRDSDDLHVDVGNMCDADNDDDVDDEASDAESSASEYSSDDETRVYHYLRSSTKQLHELHTHPHASSFVDTIDGLIDSALHTVTSIPQVCLPCNLWLWALSVAVTVYANAISLFRCRVRTWYLAALFVSTGLPSSTIAFRFTLLLFNGSHTVRSDTLCGLQSYGAILFRVWTH